MATQSLQIKIEYIQPPIDGSHFSYRITKNSVGVTYSSSTGSISPALVDKTFRKTELRTVNRLANILSAGGPGAPVSSTQFNNVANSISGIQISGVTYAVIGGSFTTFNGVSKNKLVLSTSTFSSYGGFTGPAFGSGDVTKVYVDRNNKIMVGGNFFTPVSKLTRLLTTGAVDPAWNIATWTSSGVLDGKINDIVQMSDNTYFVVGSFQSYLGTGLNFTTKRILKLNSDGTINTPFRTYTVAGFNNEVKCIKVLPDGDILCGGAFTTWRGLSARGLAKINPTTGALDSTFMTNLGAGVNGTVNSIDLQSGGLFSDDEIIIGGSFVSVNNYARQNVARLTSSGNIDTSFVMDTNGTVNKVIVVPSFDVLYGDSIYIAGAFTTINDIVYQRYGGGRLNTINTGLELFTAIQDYGFNNVVNDFGYYPYDSLGPGDDGIRFMAVGSFTQSYAFAQNTVSVIQMPRGSQIPESNTQFNLLIYNQKTGVTYSYNDALNTTYVDYIYDTTDTIRVDNILDQPGYIRLSLSDPTLGIDSTIVQTKSPHIVTTTFSSSGTVSSCRYELRTFSGNYYSDVPTLPTYVVNKNRISTSQDTFYFDMSPLVSDKLEMDIDRYLISTTYSTTTLQDIGTNEAAWVQLTATPMYGTFSASASIVRYFADEGKGWTYEGVNPQPDYVFMTGDKTIIAREGTARIYFKTGNLTNITYRGSNQTTNQTISVTASVTLSTQYVSSIKIANVLGADYVDYNFNYGAIIITKRFYYAHECKYDMNELIFQNKYGFLQSIPFSKRTNVTLTSESKSYNVSTLNLQGTFNPREHTTKTYLVEGKQEWTLNTDFMPEYYNDTFKELLLSTDIWLNTPERVYPVVLVDKAINYKTQLNDKLIQYTMRVRLAQNVINNNR